jgi:membrane associated rhomboid family serine protease
LIGITLTVSILGAFAGHMGQSISGSLVLSPHRVFQGEVWRLVTWVFVALDAATLLLGGALLYVFGSGLSERWGEHRFLRIHLGFTIATGIVTCAVAQLLWPESLQHAYAGPFPLVNALAIAWGAHLPERRLLVLFVLPVGGNALILTVLGIITIFALFHGFTPFVIDFVAAALMLIHVTTRRRQSVGGQTLVEGHDPDTPGPFGIKETRPRRS